MQYLRRAASRRWAARCRRAGARPTRSKCRALSAFEALLKGTEGPRDLHHDGVRAHPATSIIRDKKIGKLVVPIVPDESRTFGMEGMFRQLGIYSHVGQLYTPQDADQLMYYKEDKNGQILQEGINEAGAMSLLDRGGDLVQHARRSR